MAEIKISSNHNLSLKSPEELNKLHSSICGPGNFGDKVRLSTDGLAPLMARKTANLSTNLNPAFIGPSTEVRAALLFVQSHNRAMHWAEEVNLKLEMRQSVLNATRSMIYKWSNTKFKKFNYESMLAPKKNALKSDHVFKWLRELQSTDQFYIDRCALRTASCIGLADMSTRQQVQWERRCMISLREVERKVTEIAVATIQVNFSKLELQETLRKKKTLEMELAQLRQVKLNGIDPVLAEIMQIHRSLELKVLEMQVNEPAAKRNLRKLRIAVVKPICPPNIVRLIKSRAFQSEINTPTKVVTADMQLAKISAIKKFKKVVNRLCLVNRFAKFGASATQRRIALEKTAKCIDNVKKNNKSLAEILDISEKAASHCPLLRRPLIHEKNVRRHAKLVQLPNINLPLGFKKNESVEDLPLEEMPEWMQQEVRKHNNLEMHDHEFVDQEEKFHDSDDEMNYTRRKSYTIKQTQSFTDQILASHYSDPKATGSKLSSRNSSTINSKESSAYNSKSSLYSGGGGSSTNVSIKNRSRAASKASDFKQRQSLAPEDAEHRSSRRTSHGPDSVQELKRPSNHHNQLQHHADRRSQNRIAISGSNLAENGDDDDGYVPPANFKHLDHRKSNFAAAGAPSSRASGTQHQRDSIIHEKHESSAYHNGKHQSNTENDSTEQKAFNNAVRHSIRQSLLPDSKHHSTASSQRRGSHYPPQVPTEGSNHDDEYVPPPNNNGKGRRQTNAASHGSDLDRATHQSPRESVHTDRRESNVRNGKQIAIQDQKETRESLSSMGRKSGRESLHVENNNKRQSMSTQRRGSHISQS